MKTDITVFQHIGKSYQRTVVYDVNWQGKIAVNVDSNGGLKAADGVTVFIPQTALSIKISNGDTIVKGIVDKEISLVRELHEAYDDTITVMAVKYCESHSGKLNHWEVTGK